MVRPWIAFFSQTGTEIVDIIDKLGKYPDQIITNHVKNVETNLVHHHF